MVMTGQAVWRFHPTASVCPRELLFEVYWAPGLGRIGVRSWYLHIAGLDRLFLTAARKLRVQYRGAIHHPPLLCELRRDRSAFASSYRSDERDDSR